MPIIVCVLPDPVAPYANTVQFIPLTTPDIKPRPVASYTSAFVASSLNATSNVYRLALLRRWTWSKYAFSSSGSITTTVSRFTTRKMLFIRRTFRDDRTDVAVLLVEYLARAFGVDEDVAFRSARSPLAWPSDATSAGRVRTATSNLAV